jgi:hypothetical protein
MSKTNRNAVIIGIVLLAVVVLTSALTVDWMNYFFESGSIYSFYAKPVVTLLSLILVVLMKKNSIKGWWLLLAAFVCMFVTDILMSIVPLSAAETVGGTTFMIGGILSIVAHALIILRIRENWYCIKNLTWKRAWLPILVYGVAVVAIVILWKDIVRVGHGVLAPVYTFFFCTTMWFSWETLRSKLFPKINAVMMGLAATGWFLTEIFGEIYNLQIGHLSAITFNVVWIFYGSNVILWALSTIDWKGKSSSEPAV